MKYLLIGFGFYVLTFGPLSGQTTYEEEVRAVIQEMFDGMRTADSARVHAVISDEAGFYTSAIRDGSPALMEGSLKRFLQSVGSPHEQIYDERIDALRVHVDDNLATAWMNYQFYLGEKFSHCGVNTMTLHRGSDGWKIIFLADTRRKDACNE